VKLAIGTGNAGGVPSGPAARSSTDDAGATTGRSGLALGVETGRTVARGFAAASRDAAGCGAGFLATGVDAFTFGTDFAAVFGFAAPLVRAFIFAGFETGRARPPARFFCADVEDFVALAMGVPR
jgi:hypothetical protein